MSGYSKKPKGTFEDFIGSLLFAALLAVIVRSFLFEPFSIPSGSMKPNLLVGDFLFVNKHVYGWSRYSFPLGMGPITPGTRTMGESPARGDIIVFKLPSNPSVDYIKRVIGLPGDTVQMVDGRLYINDTIVPRAEVGTETSRSETGFPETLTAYQQTLPNGVSFVIFERSDVEGLDDTPAFTVPENHVFAMGDNRDNSQDSRVSELVGFIPMENIVGRAERIFFSVDSAQSQLWEIWNWPSAVRFDRILSSLHTKSPADDI